MRFTAISGLVFAALLQVGQQPGVTGPPALGAGGGTITGPIFAPQGCATPPYGFSGLGFATGVCYNTPTSELFLQWSAGNELRVGPSYAFTPSFRAGSTSLGYTFGDDLDTGIRNPSPGANLLDLVAGNVNSLQIQTTGISVNGELRNAQGSESGQTKALTESSATAFIRFDLSGSGNDATGGELHYCIVARDAANERQVRCAKMNFAIASVGGVETCSLSASNQGNDGNADAITSGTLTYAFTTDTTPTNGCEIEVNAVSSLTQVNFDINFKPHTPRDITWVAL